MKKAMNIIGIALLVIAIFFAITIGIFIYNSPGKLAPLRDGTRKDISGALTEKHKMNIGGIEQGLFIRSENPDNPVILFLHGGPGSPELPLLIPVEKEERLEKYFTMVYWDQRGAGMSYHDDIDPATMTLEQMVADTAEVTQYIQGRFNQDKIILMGHSWGSYLGVKTVEKHPELYQAYIGIGQVCNQRLSEKLAYDYLLAQAQERNDKKATDALEKVDANAPSFPENEYIMTARSSLMNKYGVGIQHKGASTLAIVKDMMLFRGYTPNEKRGYGQGLLFSQQHLFSSMLDDDLNASSTVFQIPVFITHGKYDYQVSHELAKQYVENLQAPDKDFITFDESAHSPILEEPERFTQVVRDLVDRSAAVE